MRVAFTWIAIVAFAFAGVAALHEGASKAGVAMVLLSVVNWLLLV